MAAVSSAALVNRSLTLLGEARITTLGDDNPRGRVALAIYDQVRDDVLAETRWNCAIKRVVLNLISDQTPIYGFSNLFQLPSDFIRMDQPEDQTDDFRIEEDKIATNSTSFKISYVFRLTDVSKMDSPLQTAIVYKLAFEMAIALKSSDGKQKQMYELYEQEINKAKLADAQQSPLETIESSAWVEGRRTGIGSTYRAISRP